MGSKKTKTTTSGTTTPTVTEPYNSLLSGYAGQIGDFLDTDPTGYVAPVSDLQDRAFGMAGDLGGWQDYLSQASGYANQVGNAPATQVNATGYNAPTLGSANQFGGAQLGSAAQHGGTQLADPTRLLEYMDDYQNPYTERVIDATLADYDEYAGRQQAALAAKGAAGGAFGGSRWGIAEGTLGGELARGRASTEAGLLDQQYRLAAQLAGQDAGAANQFAMQQGLFDHQTGQLNMNALNQFAMQQGMFDQQSGLANQDASNQFRLTQFGADTDAARYGADATNQAEFANADLQEQQYLRQLQSAGLLGDLSQLYGTQSLADIGMTAGLGEQQRDILSEYYNAIPTQLQLAGNLYSQLYPGMYTGSQVDSRSTSKESGGFLPALIGSGLQAASQIKFSDRRLKTNLKLVSRDPDGLGWYDWNWKSDPNGVKAHGVIADEVRQIRPWAYVENYRHGYDGVDYAKLTEMRYVA